VWCMVRWCGVWQSNHTMADEENVRDDVRDVTTCNVECTDV